MVVQLGQAKAFTHPPVLITVALGTWPRLSESGSMFPTPVMLIMDTERFGLAQLHNCRAAWVVVRGFLCILCETEKPSGQRAVAWPGSAVRSEEQARTEEIFGSGNVAQYRLLGNGTIVATIENDESYRTSTSRRPETFWWKTTLVSTSQLNRGKFYNEITEG